MCGRTALPSGKPGRRGEGRLPHPIVLHRSPFWNQTAEGSGRRVTQRAPVCACAVSGSDVLVGTGLYLDRVGDDETSFVGPTELQCLWFGPLEVCPQLFLFSLVLPQVFQIECLHSCFLFFQEQAREPKIQASPDSTSLCQKGQISCNCSQK